MFRRFTILGALLFFVLLTTQKAFSVPAVTEPAVPVVKTEEVKQAEAKAEAEAKVKAEEDASSLKDDKNPAKRSVTDMLDKFNKMADNRQKYLDGKQSYEQYLEKDRVLSGEASTHIDFWDVCEKSLKYDYDPRHKKFRKDHWAKKSQEDKASFAKLFTQLIEEIVYPIAGGYFNDLTMTHKVLESKKDYVYIKTVVRNSKKRKNRDFIMEWFLHPSDKGTWVVYDVGVEGERWVEGFRSQFNDVITKKSYKELIKMMKKKLAEVKEDRHTDDRKDFDKAKKERAEAKLAK